MPSCYYRADQFQTDGPDVIDLQRIRGDIFARQEFAEEAGEIFGNASKDIGGLDAAFKAVESLMPS